jgi:hypothetical protein
MPAVVVAPTAIVVTVVVIVPAAVVTVVRESRRGGNQCHGGKGGTQHRFHVQSPNAIVVPRFRAADRQFGC